MRDNRGMPDIFSHDDHRAYIAEAIDDLRRHRRGFSLRWLAQRCGFSSHTYLPKVVSGERNLAPETIDRVGAAFGLKGIGLQCFRLLVAWNQEDNDARKAELKQRLDGVRAVGRKKRLEGRQARYYDAWYHPILRQVAVWADWKGDWNRLGSLLDPPVTGEEAKASIELLVELGLLEPMGDRYVSAHATINVDRLPPASKRRGRHEILRRGMDSLQRHPPEERHTTCLLLAMSEDSYRQATEILSDAARRCMSLAAADPRVDRVWQMALQVFPASARLGNDA